LKAVMLNNGKVSAMFSCANCGCFIEDEGPCLEQDEGQG
jgi:hypothetical protein